MNTLKLLIQIGCLSTLCVIALILAHMLPAEKRPAQTLAETEVKWKYTEFQFTGRSDIYRGQKTYPHLVFYDLNAETLGLVPVSTNRVIAADQVLSEIAKDGWQFVWCDGTNFIMRRPEGGGRHADFEIENLPQSE